MLQNLAGSASSGSNVSWRQEQYTGDVRFFAADVRRRRFVFSTPATTQAWDCRLVAMGTCARWRRFEQSHSGADPMTGEWSAANMPPRHPLWTTLGAWWARPGPCHGPVGMTLPMSGGKNSTWFFFFKGSGQTWNWWNVIIRLHNQVNQYTILILVFSQTQWYPRNNCITPPSPFIVHLPVAPLKPSKT